MNSLPFTCVKPFHTHGSRMLSHNYILYDKLLQYIMAYVSQYPPHTMYHNTLRGVSVSSLLRFIAFHVCETYDEG